MPLERSPPKTGLGVPCAQQTDVPANASLPQQHDPKHGFFWASQLLNVERCDNQLNPPNYNDYQRYAQRAGTRIIPLVVLDAI